MAISPKDLDLHVKERADELEKLIDDYLKAHKPDDLKKVYVHIQHAHYSQEVHDEVKDRFKAVGWKQVEFQHDQRDGQMILLSTQTPMSWYDR